MLDNVVEALKRVKRSKFFFGFASLALAVPFSVAPWGNEPSAHAVAPELVAFGQAGQTSAPSQWASRILVEDFNSTQITTTSLANGYTSPVGVFESSGNAGIFGASQWGGAPCSDCSGSRADQFPAIGGASNDSITLTLSDQSNFKYVGFAWSAGNNSNTVCLLAATGNNCLAEYSTTDLLAHSSFTRAGVTGDIWRSKPHYGNPRGRGYQSPFSCNAVNLGNSWGSEHCGEPFAFIHIFQDSGFARVKFTSPIDGGFEFDNVTASTAESWELIDLLPSGTLIGASNLPAYSLTSPSVIPVDPRSESISFPGVLLGGDAATQPNASLCITEVDSAGTPVAAGTSNLRVTATVPASGVTAQYQSPRTVFSGAQATIRDLSATIRINSSTVNRFVIGIQSKYLRISVQARTGTGLTTCSGTNNVITAALVELRPLQLIRSHTFGIPID